MSENHVSRFDEVSKAYLADLDNNLRLTGGDSHFFYTFKIQHLKKIVTHQPRCILDFGCATGEFTKMLADAFPEAQITGYDPAVECIKVAKQSSTTSPVKFIANLQEFTDKPDLIVSSGVFHHIQPEDKQNVLNDLFKLMAPGGKIVIFEHNPYSPLARLIVALAPVDKGATLIRGATMQGMLKTAGFTGILTKYISFFPPFLRFLLPTEKYLENCPAGAQYIAVGQK